MCPDTFPALNFGGLDTGEEWSEENPRGSRRSTTRFGKGTLLDHQ